MFDAVRVANVLRVRRRRDCRFRKSRVENIYIYIYIFKKKHNLEENKKPNNTTESESGVPSARA
jgi:hypothetical protein